MNPITRPWVCTKRAPNQLVVVVRTREPSPLSQGADARPKSLPSVVREEGSVRVSGEGGASGRRLRWRGATAALSSASRPELVLRQAQDEESLRFAYVQLRS